MTRLLLGRSLGPIRDGLSLPMEKQAEHGYRHSLWFGSMHLFLAMSLKNVQWQLVSPLALGLILLLQLTFKGILCMF